MADPPSRIPLPAQLSHNVLLLVTEEKWSSVANDRAIPAPHSQTREQEAHTNTLVHAHSVSLNRMLIDPCPGVINVYINLKTSSMNNLPELRTKEAASTVSATIK